MSTSPAVMVAQGCDDDLLTARARRQIPLSFTVPAAAVAALLVIGLVGPLVMPYSPDNGDLAVSLSPPSSTHFLGTDLYGRDIFTRLVYGTRTALLIALACVLASFLIGSLWGLVAAVNRGFIETLLMRVVDIVLSFPYLVLVIAVVAALGPGIVTVVVAIVIANWTVYARLVYSQVLAVREREYVVVCRSQGMSQWRIMIRHIFPNVAAAPVTYASMDMSQVILLTGALSFLGLGVQPPTPDWGYMINEGRIFLSTNWWVSGFPSIAIVVAGLAFVALGSGLTELLRVPR
jgi:peptide/nickel transport system permease protein